ncbi:MAG: hypothetical protein WC516_07365 [Patescibacteria group bacterium]
MNEKNTSDAKPRNWFMRHKIITVLLGLFVLGIIGSAMGGGQSASKSNQTDLRGRSGEQKEAQVPAIVVTPAKIVADYEANGVAADEMYKGKTVEMSGTIKDINKDIMNTPYITLESGNVVWSVQCMFEKSNTEKLVSLSQNQKITVTGVVSGKLGNVLVKECSIVE